VSANPANWTPNIMNGRVLAVVQIGSKVIVGGTFTQVQASGSSVTLTRNRVFAFDMNTGTIDTAFVPQVNGDVESLAPGPDGQSVFVGGRFSSVNGNGAYRRLVRLSLSSGQVVSGFRPNPGAVVRALVLRGTWLYASGAFQQIGGQSRAGLARLNPTTGAVDTALNVPFSAPQNGGGFTVSKIDVSPDGSRLVAIGNFSQVAGQPRNQIAVVNLNTAPPALASWQTDQFPFFVPNTTTTWCSAAFATWMHDVDISPDGQYFVVVTTGAYRANRLCDSVSRWELGANGPGQQPTWVDWAGGDTFWGVGVTGTAIYVGGHPRWMNNPYRGDQPGPGAVPREGIAALDPINGLPLSWNPGRARGVGTFDIVGTPDGLWIGSDTDRIGGEMRRKIAFMPLAGGTVVPPDVPYGLPNDLYRIDEATSTLTRRSFDGTALGAPTTLNTGVNWSTTRGAFALNGRLYTGQSNGTLTSRSFDGTTMGPSTLVDLRGLEVAPGGNFLIPGTNTPVPGFNTHLASMTGMFFENGRIYYTVSGNPRLYYRYFTTESQVVGANLFVASTTTVDWSNVRGMTMASGNLYFALANGNLFRVAWLDGKPSGTPVQIGGPGLDGLNWSSRGLFVYTAAFAAAMAQELTTPGQPSGVSTTFDSIDLTWSASQGPSQPITYRVYRDGNPTAVGSVQSSSTTTVTFKDSGLLPGSTHTYTVDAMDPAGNVSQMSAASAPITVLTETDPPTQPGKPTGSSTSSDSISISWASSTDASLPITYRIYRDGAGPVATTTATSFNDTGLAPGSTHTYVVEPVDGAQTVGPPSPASDPITVMSAFVGRIAHLRLLA
jgi:chitodextrinase